MAGLGLGGNMNVNASPNLWDQTADAKANKLKGVQSLRPVYSGLGDAAGTAAGFQTAGNAAMQNSMDMYAAQANGTAPSLANAQMQQGIAQNNQAAMGLLGQSRGGNIAGSYQQALGAQQGANMMGAQQGAINRMAEQQAGLAGYSQLAGQAGQLGLGYSSLASQNALAGDQNALGWYAAERGMDLQQQAGDRQFIGGLINSGISAAGSLAGGLAQMSDERVKVGLGALPPGAAGQAVGEIQPVAWDRYSDPSMGNGQSAGVSAQQLAGTSLGGLVHQGPDGLGRVDVGGAATTALAASADHEHRMRSLEQRLDASEAPQGGAFSADPEKNARAEAGFRAFGDAASKFSSVNSSAAQGYGSSLRPIGDIMESAEPEPVDVLDREKMMQAGGEAMRHGSADQGAVRELQAQQMSRELSAARGLGQVQRGREEGMGGPAYDFGERAPMMREWSPTGDIYAIDPFEGEPVAPPQREPMAARAMPRRREDVQAMSGLGGMRATPVAGNSGNPDRLVTPRPYFEGDARPYTADGRRDSGQITPEWQAAIDSIRDEQDRWISRDETGRPVFTGKPLDLGVAGRTDQRYIDDLDELDRQALLWQRDQAQSKLPPAGMI